MLTKEAKNKSNCFKNRFYFNSARSAFFNLLKNLNLKSEDTILFPAYIGQSPVEGSGVFDPVRNLKLNYQFYKVNEDLSVDFENIKKIAEETKIKILFVIHYFGFVQRNIEEIAKYCKGNNIILIEDCAHSLLSRVKDKQAGTFGDFSLFSIHKICSSQNGGFLEVKNNNFEYSRFNIDNEDLLQFVNADIDVISYKRKTNYEYYLKKLKDTNLYEIFYKDIPQEVVPLNFPILIKNADRYEIYKKLLAVNVPCVSLWHTLISEINQEYFPISKRISKEILNLPVHQDITFEDIDYIVSKINSI